MPKAQKIIPDKPLTPKQERFAAEYIIDMNATQAALRAGYSPKGAEVTGFHLLRNPKIQQIIANYKQTSIEKLESDYHIIKERVIREVAKYAFMKVDDVSEENSQEAVKIYDMKSRHKIKALELIITTLQYDKEPSDSISEISITLKQIE